MAYKVFANTLLVIAVATLVIFPPLPNLESIAPDGFNLDIGTELTAATVISFDADTVNDYLAVLSALAAAAAIAAIIGAIIAIVVGLIALIKWIWKQFRKGHRLKEWEDFKDDVVASKDSCASAGGTYKSDHPPLWTCEDEQGRVILRGDYSDNFTGTPWDGDPRNRAGSEGLRGNELNFQH